MNNLNCVKKQESEKEETTDSNAKDLVQENSEEKETEEKMEIKRKNSNSKTRRDKRTCSERHWDPNTSQIAQIIK